MKRVIEKEGELGVVNCLMLLSKVGESIRNHNNGGGDYKCKTCQRQFLSFQALGGHRASHKKINLMGANLSSSSISSSTMKKRTKIHMCPICGVGFRVGQALGGHMRKHRNNNDNNDDGLVNNIHDHNLGATRVDLCMDLNLTPSQNNDLKLSLGLLMC